MITLSGMITKKVVTTLWAGVVAVGLMGCDELTDLDVVNTNAPDQEQALKNPGDVETLIGGSMSTWWVGLNGWSDVHGAGGDGGFSAMLTTMGDESSMSWGNWGMKDMSSEPRIAWPNRTTYAEEQSLAFPWFRTYAAISAVRDGIVAIDGGLVIEDTDGNDVTQRALAFAKFMQGVAFGSLALIHDQAFIIDENTDLTGELTFATHQEMMTAAIASLTKAIEIAQANTFTTSDVWINKVELSNTELAQLAHSFIARYMAHGARTAAERAAADWGTIISHIDAGITTDFEPEGGGSPFNVWFDNVKWMEKSDSWDRADYRVVGGVRPNDPETDPDGTYAAWLALTPAKRTEYHLNTQDKRIQKVAGVDILSLPEDDEDWANSAVDPGTDFRYAGPDGLRAGRGLYHFSMYMPYKYAEHGRTQTGPMTYMTVEEMNLLKAEGLLQQGLGGAAALINLTRVARGGLIAATDGDADIWEKMYYEKLIEQFNTAAGLAWTERRGAKEISVTSGTAGMTLWGLVPGTPRHFPVAAKELEVLRLPTYTFGGSGPDMAPAVAGLQVTVPATAVYAFNPEWTTAEKLRYLEDLLSGSGSTSYHRTWR